MLKRFLTTVFVTCFLAGTPNITEAQDNRSDDLVAEMELEITIREISKETRKQARQMAWKGVKKTTLYAKYQRAYEDWKNAVPEELDKAVEDASAALDAAMAEWRKTLARNPVASSTPAPTELIEKHRKLFDERSRLSLEALDRVEGLLKEVNSLVDRFARRIYLREMERRLTELKVKITEKVLEKIRRSYKRHEA